MKVVIFCGGIGIRMGESSLSVPKPMVPVGNRPILWHIMKYYAHFGHNEFILCLGHRAEAVKEFFLTYNEALSNDFVLSQGGKRIELLRSDIDDWEITFVDTGLHSSVGERLKAIEPHLGDDDVFLATYGDGLTDAPLPELIATVLERDKVGGFLCARPRSYSFHTVAVGDGDLVSGIQDVTETDIWINGGFFVFRRQILEYIRDGEDLVNEPFARLIADEQLLAYRYDGFWAPMDTLKDKHNLDALFERGAAPWELWEDGRTNGRRNGAAATTSSLC